MAEYVFLILMLIFGCYVLGVGDLSMKKKKQKAKGKKAWLMWYRTVYLNSPHWRRVREAAMKRDGFRCTNCGKRDDLQVHHLNYQWLHFEHRHL